MKVILNGHRVVCVLTVRMTTLYKTVATRSKQGIQKTPAAFASPPVAIAAAHGNLGKDFKQLD